MSPIDLATEKMLLGKDEAIIELFFTVRQVVVETDSRLVESIKWGMPHFEYNGLLLGVGAFKKHVALWFHKGDKMSNNLSLFNADSKAKTMGQIKISQLSDVNSEGILINENLPSKKKNSTKAKKPAKQLIKSIEFENAITEHPEALDFFNSMTVSQRNGYLEYIEEAKTFATKHKRIIRSIERLNQGLKAIY